MALLKPAMVVAIPARNEAQLLPRCLCAIEGQTGIARTDVAVVVAANNCDDATADVARAFANASALHIHVVEASFPPAMANAGSARRLAMSAAADLACETGILVSTDADAFADPDWLACLRSSFAPGVDAVAGRVSGDWDEIQHFPAGALKTGELEWRYQAAAVELEALIDPVAHDPWPRHGQRCGANFAVRRAAFLETGGVPALATGEDRAFLKAIELAGGKIRHAMGPHVTASARLHGRAAGGMAATLAARHGGAAAIDTSLEQADNLLYRLCRRAAARAEFATADVEGDDFETFWQAQLHQDHRLAPAPIAEGRLEVELARMEAHLAAARRAHVHG